MKLCSKTGCAGLDGHPGPHFTAEEVRRETLARERAAGIASDDYRDGASTGTHELRRRLIEASSWGVRLDRATIEAIAETLCAEYGGRVEEPPDSRPTEDS